MEYSWDQSVNDNADEILQPQGELSNNDSALVRSVLESDPSFQQLFLNGDKSQQAESLNNVNKLSSQVNGYKAQRKANASLWANQNTPNKILKADGYSIGLQDDEVARAILGSHNSEGAMGYAPRFDEDGEKLGFDLGFNNPDGSSMSTKEASELSKKFLVDTSSAKKINELRNTASDLARNGSHDSSFDNTSIRMAVNNIVKGGSQISLIYDPLVKDSSLREDLITSGYLSNIDYSSLGLTEEQIGILDADGDGKITVNDGLSEADQMSIIDNFIKNPDLERERNELITDYYTQFIKQGWDAQHQVHVNKYNASRQRALAQNRPQPVTQKRRIG